MRGERWLLRVGEFLVGRAARHLPTVARDERYREWAAELPVILGDPGIKPAAARAARMLWFAADTLRGAALGPGPARRRGAHRGAASWGKSARWLGVGAALLTALLTVLGVTLAIQAFLVYYLIFDDVSLAGYVAFVLTSLAILAGCLLRRRLGGAFWCWYSAGIVAAATGPHVSALAGHLGWGHPLPLTLISVCGYAVGAACISMAWAIVIRSAGRDRRPGMRERSDPGQLGGPGRPVPADLRGVDLAAGEGAQGAVAGVGLYAPAFLIGQVRERGPLRANALELSGHRDEAIALFDRLLAVRNDVGLLSEEYDPRYGRLVGNMPQAFSHVPLVQTALNLSSHSEEHQRGTGMHRDDRRSVPG